MSSPRQNDETEQSILDDTDKGQRRDRRVLLSIRVRYPQRNAFFSEYTRNISRGGMFIATEEPLDVGTRLRFELEIPGEKEFVSLEGEVRWAVHRSQIEGLGASAPDVEVGMGVQFVFKDDQERVALDEVVRAMVEETLGKKIAGKLMG